MGSEEKELLRLKWIAILGPLLFLALLELVRNIASPSFLNAWPGYILIAGVVLIGTLFFAETIFGIIGRMQQRLAQQNRELLALHDAGIAITSALELETVLQTVVDQARELGSARYGALSLLDDTGEIVSFLTSGITTEERTRIGPIPQGRGVLAVVIDDGTALRMADLTDDPRSVGFPPHHPPMHSLLAVPVVLHGHILGSFYLTEKEDAPEFTEDDRHRLERFATQAAIAIENASLHQRVRSLAITEERERIAREMHDTIAQVLGYVNTKAQAAQELLVHDQPDRAEIQIGQLAQAAREAYADVRQDILGLRTSLDGGRGLIDTLREYITHWEEQSEVRATLELAPPDIEEDLRITALAELQLLRIIQESLANIRKHAQARTVCVEFSQTDMELVVTIADDGIGFERDTVTAGEFPRFGLATMRERAESVHGSFDIQTLRGTGTKVIVRLPTMARVVSRGGSGAHTDR